MSKNRKPLSKTIANMCLASMHLNEAIHYLRSYQAMKVWLENEHPKLYVEWARRMSDGDFDGIRYPNGKKQ